MLFGETPTVYDHAEIAAKRVAPGPFLIYFGNVIGRSAHTIVGATKHHTNLFAVIIGKTSKGRKGSGADWVRSIFLPIDEYWSTSRIGSGLSSGEGLIKAVEDKPDEGVRPVNHVFQTDRGRGMMFGAPS